MYRLRSIESDDVLDGLGVRAMVFNVSFNIISTILWRSVLLVEETEVPGKNPIEPSQVTDKLYHTSGIRTRLEGTNKTNI